MICKNCKKEIPDDKVFCPYCGKEIRFVPDYNTFEEDVLSSIIEGQNKDDKISNSNTLSKQNNKSYKHNKKIKWTNRFLRDKKGKIKLGISIIFLLALISAVFYMNSYSYCIRKAQSSIITKNYKNALKYASRALNKKETPESYFYIGKAFYLSGKTNKSIKNLEKSLKLKNDNKEAYKYLINAYKKKDDYIKLEKLKNKAPNNEILSLFKDVVLGNISFKIIDNDRKLEKFMEINTDSDYDIYYTIDGKRPDKSTGTKYKKKILLKDGKNIIKAVLVNKNGEVGQVFTKKYKIIYKKPRDPVISLDSGAITSPTQITISADPNCRIFYTWDSIGTDPTVDSFEYTGPIDVIEGNNVLSVVAINNRDMSSNIVRRNYIYEP